MARKTYQSRFSIKKFSGKMKLIRIFFCIFAKKYIEMSIIVIRIGCVCAGFADEEIVTLFEAMHGVKNIVLSPNW